MKDLIETLNRRIATCEMYANMRALESHNMIVVSDRTNGRGAFFNGDMLAIGMFPNSMPTCFTLEDAHTIVRECKPAGETLRVIPSRLWWAKELDDARELLVALSA